MCKSSSVGIFLIFVVALNVCHAAPNPADPDLALWLKADAGVTADGSGEISAWADSRTGSTLSAVPYVATQKPELINTITPGNRTIKTVRFGASSQTNYLVITNGGTESFVIPGDMSMFVVFNPVQSGAELPSGTYHSMVALRDDDGSQYSLGLQSIMALTNPTGSTNPALGGALCSVFFNDEGADVLDGTRRVEAAQWHIAYMQIVGSTVSWACNSGSVQYGAALEDCGSETINYRPLATLAPLGIGGHIQTGVTEQFVGDIAEILIYKKVLNSTEAQAVTDYIYDKYFDPDSCGDFGTVYLPGDTTGNSGQVPVATDPALRLWLKAETKNDPNSWTDSSSYGTVFWVDTTGEAATDPENHKPQLVTVTNEDRTFKAVQFRQAYDPLTPDPLYGHLSDRLTQTNNLGAGDPTNIGPASDITMFMVVSLAAPNTALGPIQAIMAKRDTTYCPYSVNYSAYYIQAGVKYTNQMEFLDYGTPQETRSGLVTTTSDWKVVQMTITAGGTITFRDYSAATGWRSSTVTGHTRAAAFPDAMDKPLTLAYHLGNSGIYQRFGGQIAEIILYAKSLTAAEERGMQDYLVQKYYHDLADCKVKLDDFAKMAQDWMECSTPGVLGCVQ